MDVPIAPKYEDIVREKVAHGEYRSATEVIEHALDLLQQIEADDQAKLESLRVDVAAGFAEIDRGKSVPAPEVFRRLYERNATWPKS